MSRRPHVVYANVHHCPDGRSVDRFGKGFADGDLAQVLRVPVVDLRRRVAGDERQRLVLNVSRSGPAFLESRQIREHLHGRAMRLLRRGDVDRGAFQQAGDAR